jgi:hypothetical protein
MKPETGHVEANEVQKALEPLIGLKFSIARRAADMRIFHFGEIKEVDGGTIGKYALHIQCPWRMDGPEGIITGRLDLWNHISGKLMPDEWEPSTDDNIQDFRLRTLLKGYDPNTNSYVNATELLVVERVQASTVGDAIIELSGGYRLILFPAGTKGEDWRILGPDEVSPHFVMEGGEIYRV